MNLAALKKSFLAIIDLVGGGWIALLIALLVLGVIVFLVFRSGKQIKIQIPFLPKGMNTITIGKDSLKSLTGAAKDGAENEQKPLVGSLFAQLDSLSRSTKKRYDIPLYLVMSQYQSATSLIADVGEDILERLDIKDPSGANAGSCVILNHGGLLFHEDPSQLVSELVHSRPERPIDGVIFVISATDVLNEDKIARRKGIDWLFKQYWLLQKEVPFIFPVYFLITEMEKLAGFQAFAFAHERHSGIDEIFGWSSSKNAEGVFTIDMIDEAFVAIDEEVRRVINLTLSASDKVSDSLLVYPEAIKRLLGGIHEYTAGILAASLVVHPSQFRGLYFTGLLPEEGRLRYRFLRALFKQKIFPERALATPIYNQLLSSDKQLRVMQLVSAGLLTLLLAWSGVNFAYAVQRHLGLQSSVDRIADIWSTESGSAAIFQSLEVLANVNAEAAYCCGPIPLSLLISPDKNLEQYFSTELFSKKVFPVMACDSQKQMGSQVMPYLVEKTRILEPENFEAWLTNVLDRTSAYAMTRSLSREQNFQSIETVGVQFSELMLSLYGKEIPDSFQQQGDLYLQAISDDDSGYLASYECDYQQAPGSLIWDGLLETSFAQIPFQVAKAAAPIGFLQQVDQLESGALERFLVTSRDFDSFLKWHRYIEDTFLVSDQRSFCGVTGKKLDSMRLLLGELGLFNGNQVGEIDAFVSQCDAAFEQQMRADNGRLPQAIYNITTSADGFSPSFTSKSEELFSSLERLSSFNFSKVEESPWSNKQGVFFWSVERLGLALSFVDEYFTYAEGKFVTSYLPSDPTANPEAYLVQAVALATLDRALLATIEQAKFQGAPSIRMDFTTLDKRESEIADRVANFRKALNPLLALLSNLEQLGLEATRRRVLMQTHSHALELLADIDDLFESNNVYEPKPITKWTANTYLEAFYGLLSETNVKDYLAAQAQRSRIIARDYAEPLVIFLANTEGEFTDSDLLGRWRRTLIEISKRENKDPSNDIEGIEQFFLGDFASTNFSNCAAQVAAYVSPVGNNLFAIKWRNLISTATDRCQRLQADKIKGEYAAVAKAFTTYLAPFYPFNPRVSAQPLAPKSLRSFLGVYAGQADGLAERVRILTWKYPEYGLAESFLRDLDAALAILTVIVEGVVGGQPGLSIETVFEPLNNSQGAWDISAHVSKKMFRVGDEQSEFPGIDQTLHWAFNDKTAYELHWAAGSPYELLDQNRKPAKSKLVFEKQGYWSLLEFVQANRSTKIDSGSLSSESILLEFNAFVQQSSSPNDLLPIALLLRITLMGLDPATQEVKALKFPERFPTAAPAGGE